MFKLSATSPFTRHEPLHAFDKLTGLIDHPTLFFVQLSIHNTFPYQLVCKK